MFCRMMRSREGGRGIIGVGPHVMFVCCRFSDCSWVSVGMFVSILMLSSVSLVSVVVRLSMLFIVSVVGVVSVSVVRLGSLCCRLLCRLLSCFG